MGSFNSTCCFSGLPIRAGDKVRWLLLQQDSDHHGGFVCYPHMRWNVRSIPLKAEYNDYGSIENYNPEDPIIKNILLGFQEDLVEHGTGPNEFHDPPATKEMPFTQLLDTLWEGRLHVYRSPFHLEEKPITPEDSFSFKTIQRFVSEISNLIVDNLPEGVSVRNDIDGHYHKPETLEQARTLLESNGFNVKLIEPEDSNDDKYLLVTHPTRPYFYQHPTEQLLLQQAMIREDVFRLVISEPIKTWKNKKFSVEHYIENVKTFISLAKEKEEYRWHSLLLDDNDDPKPGCTIFTGLSGDSDHTISDKCRRALQTGLIDDDMAVSIAELAFFSDRLRSFNYTWRPSDTCGPQWSDWSQHLRYLKGLTAIVKELKREQNEN